MSRLTPADWVLLVRTGLLVAVIRLVLSVRPWPSALYLVRTLPTRLSSSKSRRFSPERLAWAVRNSSRLVPKATCLTQSLALQCALTAAGLSSRVEIGVAKEPGGEFQSHAWVEHAGQTLLSPPVEVRRYSRLLTVHAHGSLEVRPR
jgi:hypothetical protein